MEHDGDGAGSHERGLWSRRGFMWVGAAAAAGLARAPSANQARAADAAPGEVGEPARAFLTPAAEFTDVSRGNPKPFSLTGAARAAARLTPETWRLEVSADPFVEAPHTKVPAALAKPLTLADGTALDLPGLMDLGRAHEAHFLKAMQCLNIDTPLGQGLWTGVPLREVLRRCGKMTNVRRIYYWGFHNDDPKQEFKSSVSYTQAMETAPGELPVFLAYRLNGEAIPIERGGPVRMVVPWAYGYKSIKWLRHVFVTNDARNGDTYSNGNNDPDSYLKSAAYVDDGPAKIRSGERVALSGQVMCGLSGVDRVEYWVRRVDGNGGPLADDAPELLAGPWVACAIRAEPDWSRALPPGVRARDVLGFDKRTGRAATWPLRCSVASYSADLGKLGPGRYEVRARAVDLNGFAQPEPRPSQKSGRNGIQVRRFEVA